MKKKWKLGMLEVAQETVELSRLMVHQHKKLEALEKGLKALADEVTNLRGFRAVQGRKIEGLERIVIRTPPASRAAQERAATMGNLTARVSHLEAIVQEKNYEPTKRTATAGAGPAGAAKAGGPGGAKAKDRPRGRNGR